MVDHKGHDLVRRTFADAGDAALLAGRALPQGMHDRPFTGPVPWRAASPQRLEKPRLGTQRRLGQRAAGRDPLRRFQDWQRLLPVKLGQPGEHLTAARTYGARSATGSSRTEPGSTPRPTTVTVRPPASTRAAHTLPCLAARPLTLPPPTARSALE